MRIPGKTKFGLATLVSALFGLGCTTTFTLNYQGKNANISIPVAQTSARSVADVSSGFGSEPKANTAHLLTGILLGAGVANAGRQEEWYDEGGAYGVAAATAALYTWARWDKPWNHKVDWYAAIVGGLGLAHEGPLSESSPNNDLGGYDPGQGTDDGTGDDSDQDDPNLWQTPTDNNLDNGNW